MKKEVVKFPYECHTISIPDTSTGSEKRKKIKYLVPQTPTSSPVIIGG